MPLTVESRLLRRIKRNFRWPESRCFGESRNPLRINKTNSSFPRRGTWGVWKWFWGRFSATNPTFLSSLRPPESTVVFNKLFHCHGATHPSRNCVLCEALSLNTCYSFCRSWSVSQHGSSTLTDCPTERLRTSAKSQPLALDNRAFSCLRLIRRYVLRPAGNVVKANEQRERGRHKGRIVCPAFYFLSVAAARVHAVCPAVCTTCSTRTDRDTLARANLPSCTYARWPRDCRR